MSECALCGGVDAAFSQGIGKVVCRACYERLAPIPASGGPTACPKCRTPAGARYGPDRVCWPCFLARNPHAKRRRKPKPEAWQAFRAEVIEAMIRNGSFHYLGKDHIAGRCPICGDVLGIRFIGHTEEADFVCHGGCDALKVATALLGAEAAA